MTKASKPFINLKIYDKDKRLIKTIRSSKSRKIYFHVHNEESSNCFFKVKVTYAPKIVNESLITNKAKILKTLRAFLEVDY